MFHGSFASPVLDGASVAFLFTPATTPTAPPSLYARIDGQLLLVAKVGDSVPDGSGALFTSIAPPLGADASFALEGGRVLWAAQSDDSRNGLYLYDQGIVSALLRAGDVLDGQEVFGVAPALATDALGGHDDAIISVLLGPTYETSHYDRNTPPFAEPQARLGGRSTPARRRSPC